MPSVLQSLRVLSDPTRLRLMLLLLAEELTVAELQDILGMGQSRISASLALLKREGLASDRRVGKNIFYSARPDALTSLRPVLEAACGEIAEAAGDRSALSLIQRKRKDKAAEYFNRLAGKFGRNYCPGRSWQGLSHLLLTLVPEVVIADLGAGEGTLAQLLARRAKQVIAVDYSEKMVEFGSDLAREHGFTNLEYRLGDMENPPIAAGSVDIAILSQALHHAVSPARALQAAAQILKPGGKILVLDLLAHNFEQARELYADLWLGFGEAEILHLLEKTGFVAAEVGVVAREVETPFFQTLLAAAIKPRDAEKL